MKHYGGWIVADRSGREDRIREPWRIEMSEPKNATEIKPGCWIAHQSSSIFQPQPPVGGEGVRAHDPQDVAYGATEALDPKLVAATTPALGDTRPLAPPDCTDAEFMFWHAGYDAAIAFGEAREAALRQQLEIEQEDANQWLAEESKERKRADAAEAAIVSLQRELDEMRGTPEARFMGLMDALEQRYPDPSPASAAPFELRFLAWLDKQATAIVILQAEREAWKQRCREEMQARETYKHAALEAVNREQLAEAAIVALQAERDELKEELASCEDSMIREADAFDAENDRLEDKLLDLQAQLQAIAQEMRERARLGDFSTAVIRALADRIAALGKDQP